MMPLYKMPFLCAFIVLILTQNSTMLAAAQRDRIDWRTNDPLLYAHVVVQATISGVDRREVTEAQLGLTPSTGRSPVIATLHLSDTTSLRGLPVTTLSAEFFVDWPELVGEEVILCAYWRKDLGDFLVSDAKEVLKRDNGNWVRIWPEELIPDATLKADVASLDPQAIAARSAFVVVGNVTATADSIVSGRATRIRQVTLRVTDSIKGSLTSHSIRFNADEMDGPVPVVKTGEQWVAFLKSEKSSLWLVGGACGLLKLDNKGRMLYDGVAPARITKVELIRYEAEPAQ